MTKGPKQDFVLVIRYLVIDIYLGFGICDLGFCLFGHCFLELGYFIYSQTTY